MAITQVKFRDSVAGYTTTAQAQSLWSTYNGVSVSPGSGYLGYPAHSFVQNAEMKRNLVGTPEVNVAFYIHIPQSRKVVVNFNTLTGVVGEMVFEVDGSMRIWRGGGTLLATAPVDTFQFGVQHHVEVYHKRGDPTGVFNVWLDGTLVLSFTGNTQGDGVNDITIFAWGMPTTAGGNLFISHVWIADCSGDSHVGPRIVLRLKPNAVGTHNGFTTVGSVTHYLNVDEATPDSADYNYASVIGTKDSYGYEDLPTGASAIVDVARCPRLYVDDATAHDFRTGLISGAVTSNGAAIPTPGSAAYKQQGWLLDPDGNIAWTKAKVDALEGITEVMS